MGPHSASGTRQTAHLSSLVGVGSNPRWRLFFTFMREKLDETLKKVRSRCDRIKLQVQGGLNRIVSCGDKALVYLKGLLVKGEKRSADFVEWVKSQKSNLKAFSLRFALRLNWYMYFVANCIIAVSATSFGFALGALLTIVVYDDGLERVMDVYNYFKRPPRS